MSTPSTAGSLLPALPPAPEIGRRNVLLVGTVFVMAAGTALFGALLAGYFSARELVEAAGEAWPPDDVTIPNVPLFVGYLTLLMSAVTAQWSVSAINGRDRRSAYVAIGLTIVFGLAFVNSLSFSWSALGIAAESSRFATTMFAVTVTHLLVVIAAIVAFVVVGFRALGGQFSPENRELIVGAVAFWHFAVAAGLIIWYCIWFLEGGP